MAENVWKKVDEGDTFITWRHSFTGHHIRIFALARPNKGWAFTFELLAGGSKHFKTKSQAIAYAKRFMKKNY